MNILVSVLVLILVILAGSKMIKFLFSGSIPKFIAAAYLPVLIVSAGILYVLPEKKAENGDKTLAEAQEISSRFYGLAKYDKLDGYEGIYKNGSYSFKLEGNQLELAVQDKEGYYDIWVKRKSADDGRIEVKCYAMPSIVSGVDITKKVAPPVIKLEGDKLNIIPEKKYRLDYSEFDSGFITSQFTAGSSGSQRGGWAFFGGQSVYLYVPESMKISGSGLNINYAE